MVGGENMDEHELSYRLVELGADMLTSMLSELKAKDFEAAHYYKGGFQALKEAASSLFGIEPDCFRSQCMFEITCLRLDAQAEDIHEHNLSDKE
jgi:hypothetical protein